MDNIAIKIENLSKSYQLGQFSTGTLSKDIENAFNGIFNKKKYNPRIDQDNLAEEKSIIWPLKNISLEIEKGDTVGIIGRNGAGKSTLLKILSEVTSPTTGQILVRGRIVSLLEVGTGFHPELTGRENIYLNGAILGMRKSEITRKFDEIVQFAGVEKHIDTPVKRYSSGMYVRLAFAVAAHLESEILIVDEVLAVGDAEFQKKCLGKMADISNGEGRTVLFVSHNMAAVKELCKKSILLQNGSLKEYGDTSNIVLNYLKQANSVNLNVLKASDGSNFRRGSGEVRIVNIKGLSDILDYENEINIEFEILNNSNIADCDFTISFISETGSHMLSNIPKMNIKLNSLTTFLKIIIPAKQLRPGIYPLYIWLGKDVLTPYDILDNVFNLRIHTNLPQSGLGFNPIENGGYFNLNYKIETNVQ